MSEERKAVITVWEDGNTQIEFFPDGQSRTRGLHELLGWAGFFAIVKALREQGVLGREE